MKTLSTFKSAFLAVLVLVAMAVAQYTLSNGLSRDSYGIVAANMATVNLTTSQGFPLDSSGRLAIDCASGCTLTDSTANPWITSPRGGTALSFSTATDKAILSGTLLGFTKTTTAVNFNWTGADNTSNIYDLGIYSGTSGGTCTRVAHTGSFAGSTYTTATGWKSRNWADGSVTLMPGRYYMAYTTNCTSGCATIGGDSGGLTFAGSSGGSNSNASVGSGNGGSLPSSLTCPSDSYNTNIPGWSIN